MLGLFITGTDTGVGKTRVTAALAVLLRAEGLRVAAMKPVATGARRTPDGLVAEDTLSLLAALDPIARPALADVTPFTYEPPVSPSVAARREGRWVRFDTIVAAAQRLEAESDVLLVEGIGGAMVPLGAEPQPGGEEPVDLLVSDLCAALGLPAVVVARDALGTINHSLLTIDHLRRRGVALAGVVLNRTSPQVDQRCDNVAEIARVGRLAVYGPLPFAPECDAGRLPAAWGARLTPLVETLAAARR